MVDYFSIQNIVSRKTGRVDALFRAWADRGGVSCPQCTRLGQLFSRVIDSAKSGESIVIPQSLAIPPSKRLLPSESSRFVWQRLEFKAQQWKKTMMHTFGGAERKRVDFSTKTDPPEDEWEDSTFDEEEIFWSLVSRKDLSMSEFTKFRLIMKYLDGNVRYFMQSGKLDYVNFALMSELERGFVVQEYRIPPFLLENALRCYSHLISVRTSFLNKYGFDLAVPWKFYWRSKCASQTIDHASVLLHCLRSNTNALLLLEAPDNVVVILHLSRPLMTRKQKESFLVDCKGNSGCKDKSLGDLRLNVTSFLISGHFAINEKYSLEDPTYRMDLSGENGLQLYRNQNRAQTFIHLKIAEERISRRGRGRVTTPVQHEVLLMSVDLRRFDRRILDRRHPLVRKTPVLSAEIFVFDRRSDFNDQAKSSISYFDILAEDDTERASVAEFEDCELQFDQGGIEHLVPSAVQWRETCQQFSNTETLMSHPENQ